MIAESLSAAERGWPVFPCWWPLEDGSCACGMDGCPHPGKHPLAPLVPHGLKDATSDPAKVQSWWERFPLANLALRTGARPEGGGFFVIDVDPRSGGEATLSDLETKHGPLPQTVEVLTGGGGRHVFFALQPGLKVPTRTGVAPGIDVRGEGGYVIAPPSLHASGRRYEWAPGREPGEVEIAQAPRWVLDLVGKRGSTASAPPPNVEVVIPEGQRNATLASLAGTMRRRGMRESEIRAALQIVNSERCRPPLGDHEVAEIARSVASYPSGDVKGEAPQVPWPEPPDEAAYYGLAGDIVRAVDPSTEADPVAILVQLLVSFGSAIGRGPHFVVERDRHGANLFVVLVGRTAKARKGTSLGRVRDILRRAGNEGERWAKDCVTTGLSSGEGLIWAVRDPILKRNKKGEEETVDGGVEDKRALVVEPEYARTLRVLGREGNTLSAVVRCAWETGDLRALVKNSPAVATGAHVSIIGHVVREELRRYLADSEAAGGWANRFIHLCVRRSKCLPEGGAMSEEVEADLAARLARALDFARGVERVYRDDEARQDWAAVYPQLSEGKPGLLGAVLARAEAQVLRLSLVYALLDCSPVIRAEHQRAALALWEYAEASSKWIFAEALGNPVADKILDALRRAAPDGLVRSKISELFDHNLGTDAIEAALGLLRTVGKAHSERVDTEGRAAELWRATA